jgi:DNA-binding winged helix-turn-helix (wHTH) protein
MENLFGKIYSFDKFQLDPDERLLFDGVKTIPLAPKIFDTLLLLIENGGRVLSKERMLKEIWEDSFVEENNLAQNISYLRRILGETKDVKFIETVPKYGYRFIAPVELVEDLTETVTFERKQARILIREVITEDFGEEEKRREGEEELWADTFSSSPHLPISSSPHHLIT